MNGEKEKIFEIRNAKKSFWQDRSVEGYIRFCGEWGRFSDNWAVRLRKINTAQVRNIT